MRPIEVFLCGERFRRDDGVAAGVARLLPHDVTSLANVRETAEVAVEMLLAMPPDVAVVVVDAATGIEPGRIRRLPLDQLARSADAEASGADAASSHGMTLSSVLALAAELRGAPVHGTFIGIGGADFGYGEGLSPALAAELPALAEAVASEVRRLAAAARPVASTGDDGDAGKGRIGP